MALGDSSMSFASAVLPALACEGVQLACPRGHSTTTWTKFYLKQVFFDRIFFIILDSLESSLE